MITSKNGAKAMGKPIGTYITLEAQGLMDPDEGYHREVSHVIADQIRAIIPDSENEKSILVVGLGNMNVTFLDFIFLCYNSTYISICFFNEFPCF